MDFFKNVHFIQVLLNITSWLRQKFTYLSFFTVFFVIELASLVRVILHKYNRFRAPFLYKKKKFVINESYE